MQLVSGHILSYDRQKLQGQVNWWLERGTGECLEGQLRGHRVQLSISGGLGEVFTVCSARGRVGFVNILDLFVKFNPAVFIQPRPQNSRFLSATPPSSTTRPSLRREGPIARG